MSELDFSFDEEEKIAKRTSEAIDAAESIDDPFAKIDAQLEAQLAQVEGVNVKDIEIGPLDTTFDQVFDRAEQDRTNLAGTVLALQELNARLSSRFGEFGEDLHPLAQKIIDDANAGLETARSALSTAEGDVRVAQAQVKDFILFKLGEDTVKAKTALLSQAQAKLAEAQKVQKDAPEVAAAKNGKIIEDLSMEDLALEIRRNHDRANELLRARIERTGAATERQERVLEVTRDKEVESIELHSEAKTRYEELLDEVSRLETDMQNSEFEAKTPEYMELETQLNAARDAAGNAKADMDKYMGVSQILSEKVQALTRQLEALVTLKGNYERSYESGKIEAQLNQEITARRVEIMKGVADLAHQARLNEMGRHDSVHAAQAASGALSAVEQHRVEVFATHPKIMQAYYDLEALVQKSASRISEADKALYEEWRRKNFGDSGDAESSGDEKSSDAFVL